MIVLTFLASFFINNNVIDKCFLEYYYHLLNTCLYKKTCSFLSSEKILSFFSCSFLELKYIFVDFIMEILFLFFYKNLKDVSSLEIKKTKHLTLLILLKLKKLSIISLKTNLLTLYKFLFLKLYDTSRMQMFFFFTFDIIRVLWRPNVILSTLIYSYSSFLWEFLSIYSLQKFIKIKMKCLDWTRQFHKKSTCNICVKKKEVSVLQYNNIYTGNTLIYKFKSALLIIFRVPIKINYKLYQNIFLINEMYKIHIFMLIFYRTKYFSYKKLFKSKCIKFNSTFYKVKIFNIICTKKKILILKSIFKFQIETSLFFFYVFQQKFRLNTFFFNLKLKKKFKRLTINVCVLYHIKLYYVIFKYFYFVTMFYKKFSPKFEKSLKKKNRFFYKKTKLKFEKEKQINYTHYVFFRNFFLRIFSPRLKFYKKNSLLKKSKQKKICFDFFNREFFL